MTESSPRKKSKNACSTAFAFSLFVLFNKFMIRGTAEVPELEDEVKESE